MRLSNFTSKSRLHRLLFTSSILILALSALVWAVDSGLARTTALPQSQVSPLHPAYALLDLDGIPVIESGNPVSTMQTCGTCHDTAFIADHSYHTDVGLDSFGEPGSTSSQRPWDASEGFFGRWNPIVYRYLSPEGDERIDLTTAAWIMTLGARHVGGGPAVSSREGVPLAELDHTPGDTQTNIVDPESGSLTAWDWQESGVVEMNCFLCHTPNPNNPARIQALQDGNFQWANAATLLGTGIIERQADQYSWNLAAFDREGQLEPDYITIQDPSNENCGLCHGLVHTDPEEPLILSGCSPERYRTETSGQIISSERISESGVNLENKADIQRSWDVHAERQLSCTDCHYSINNPVYYQESDATRPGHLEFDPRRLEFGEYLQQPLHQFARGQSAQGTVSPELRDTMRRCESCHSTEVTHNWLPYKDSHFSAVSCETCHIPKLYSTAFQQYDWTVIEPDLTASTACRGIQGPSGSVNSLITGFDPLLVQRVDDSNSDASGSRIAPFNTVTSWFWVYGDPERPVRLGDLEAAWLENDSYHPDVLAVFDQNGDSSLDQAELQINTPEKHGLIAARLSALGLENVHIAGEIQPYSINHNVTRGEWAIKDCQTCHTEDSRLSAPFKLASYVPAGILPEFVKDANISPNGTIYQNESGELYFQPSTADGELYLLGHDNVGWIDLLGSLMFAGVLLGVFVHAGIRVYSSIRQPHHEPQVRKVYMYSVYERFWHWVQTFVIVGLLFTGLIIHKPDTFGIFSFTGMVVVHNILAAILLINAVLSLFYHLASGEIKQFIPRSYGFVDQAVAQTLFYMRGIFKREPHPFEKSPQKKFNALQQVTYFAILNILLPLQGITGALIWGVQRWPDLAARLGGLPFLAPFHTLLAWTFASFIVLHVYLTTTGHAPLAGIKSMMVGWDELEVAQPTAKEEATA